MLPENHLNPDTKDAVKVGMGLVATMAALVLGLLVASTKGAYDAQKGEVTQMAAKVVFLDRVLANYGSETAQTRNLLRRSLASAINRMWRIARFLNLRNWTRAQARGRNSLTQSSSLSPQNEAQRSLKVSGRAGHHRCWANALVAGSSKRKARYPFRC